MCKCGSSSDLSAPYQPPIGCAVSSFWVVFGGGALSLARASMASVIPQNRLIKGIKCPRETAYQEKNLYQRYQQQLHQQFLNKLPQLDKYVF